VITIEQQRLNEEQVNAVLQTLFTTPVSERHPLLTAMRENITASVREEFAWSLFQLWKDDGFPSKEKWAMGAIGHLGGDAAVMQLTPLIRVWPGESQHQRAVFGLECLRAVGGSTALMQLSGIAQKLKYKGLKSKAQNFVEIIAKERGLSRDELEDRVVPDCGLDENGRREFSFGSRSFSFVLSGDLKAMVRDETGKVRPNLPKPAKKDDSTIAKEAVAEWKLLKKQIKDVAKLQATRLEQSTVTGRRWTVDEFESLLVRHPLMTHLTQKLIWGGYTSGGKRLVSFRVTEERDYANLKDDQAKLGKSTHVGIVHPLDLDEREVTGWGELMSDYELIAPFSQLGRPVFSLEKGEAAKIELERFHNMQLYATTMVFTLEKLGWARGIPMDAGIFDEHSKQFPTADVTAVIGYDGTVGMGYIEPTELLTTNSIHFCKGLREPSVYMWSKAKKLKLKDVPAIVVSEVIADLHVLVSKSK